MSAEKKKVHFIMKTSNQASPLDKYFEKVERFRGRMDTLANSIEILLNNILKRLGITPPNMFGRKICIVKTNKRVHSTLHRCTPNFDELVYRLERFNENWNISKHGMISADSEEPKVIKFVKDNFEYVFDEKKIEEIEQEFTQIQQTLITIQKSLAKIS